MSLSQNRCTLLRDMHYRAAMTLDSVQVPRLSLAEILFGIFLRLVAVSCFWFGLNYWGLLIGYTFDGAGRFDLLPVAWRVAATTLAVIYPVAALGLWLTVSWGPVIWIVAAAAEIAMFGFYPQIFGTKPFLLVLHGTVAVVFVLFRIVILLQRSRQAKAARNDSP
ncbi:DUF6163 family protein [Pararhizobium arenae]|uniref:DUF6163 family protein n=1 Tax=Pararhizobium arenae TaxID=1856850 RepID=UPI00315A8D37